MPTTIAISRASALRGIVAAVAVPWDAFVAVFIYYTLLTLAAIGIADLATGFVAVSYLLPVVLYAGLLVSRAVRALAALPIDIGPAPEALLH